MPRLDCVAGNSELRVRGVTEGSLPEAELAGWDVDISRELPEGCHFGAASTRVVPAVAREAMVAQSTMRIGSVAR